MGQLDVVKQNLFQLNQRSKMETVKNVLVLMIGIAGMVFMAFTLGQEDPRIAENKRIIDSLHSEIVKNERRRDSLMAVIKNLDFEIQEQERVIDSLNKRKPTPLPQPLPPPKPSDARTILDKFRKG